MTGLWVVLGVLALCTAFGLVQRSRSGRFRAVGRRAGAVTAAAATEVYPLPPPAAPAAASVPSPPAAASGPQAEPLTGPLTTSPATSPAHLLAASEPDDGSLREVLAALGEQPGERATLLQFSSAFCAPCRATRRILGEVAELVPGVRHVEVDAEQHLDVVRRLKIMKTPTTLVLDADAKITARATGQPRKTEVLNALGHAVP